MKLKLLFIGVLLIASIWFVSFLMALKNTPVNHGKVISTNTLHTIECGGWGIGSWSNVKCENVGIKHIQ